MNKSGKYLDLEIRARIFKLLRTPVIDSTESIPCEMGIDHRRGERGLENKVDSSFKN
jgi:hypothetical protein